MVHLMTPSVTAAPLRHLVVWRGRSRHTYGFEGQFDLPQLELEALLSVDADCRPLPMLSPVLPAGPDQDSAMCWVDVETPQAQSALTAAASRAVLTHAVFVVAAAAASVAAAAAAARAAGCNLPDAEAVEVLDLDEPNLRAHAREAALAELCRGLGSPETPAASHWLASGGGAATQHLTTWVLLRMSGPPRHMLGWRVASGAAAGRGGALGRAVRRPAGGWLSRYALKRRRHNAATAIEPELGFLLANVARVAAGSDVLDPCCGGGGLLVCAAALGARTFGVDRNASMFSHAAEDFAALALPAPHLCCDDVMAPATWMLRPDTVGGHGPDTEEVVGPDGARGAFLDTAGGVDPNTARGARSPSAGFYDAVLCDPPYGMRAPVLRNGMGTTWQQAMPSDITSALLALSAGLLKPGGRMALFLPARGAEAELSLEELVDRRVAASTGSAVTAGGDAVAGVEGCMGPEAAAGDDGGEIDSSGASGLTVQPSGYYERGQTGSGGDLRGHADPRLAPTSILSLHDTPDTPPAAIPAPSLSALGLRLVFGRKQRFHTRKSRRAGSSAVPILGGGTGAFARWLCVFEREAGVPCPPSVLKQPQPAAEGRRDGLLAQQIPGGGAGALPPPGHEGAGAWEARCGQSAPLHPAAVEGARAPTDTTGEGIPTAEPVVPAVPTAKGDPPLPPLIAMSTGSRGGGYAAAIRGCIDAAGARAALASLCGAADVYTFTSAIAACGRCGDWRAALDLYEQMQSSGIAADAAALNAALGACARAGRGAEAVSLLNAAERSGLRLEPGCYSTTARALLAEGDAFAAAEVALRGRRVGGWGFGDVRIAVAACEQAGMPRRAGQMAAQALARDAAVQRPLLCGDTGGRSATPWSDTGGGSATPGGDTGGGTAAPFEETGTPEFFSIAAALPAAGAPPLSHALRPEQRLYFWYAWRGALLAQLDAAMAVSAAASLTRPPRGINGGDAPRADPMRSSLSLAASTGLRPSFTSDGMRAGYANAHLPTRVAKIADTLALESPSWLRPAVTAALAHRALGVAGAERGAHGAVGEGGGGLSVGAQGVQGVQGGERQPTAGGQDDPPTRALDEPLQVFSGVSLAVAARRSLTTLHFCADPSYDLSRAAFPGTSLDASADTSRGTIDASDASSPRHDAVALGCGPGFDLAALALLQPLLALPALACRRRAAPLEPLAPDTGGGAPSLTLNAADTGGGDANTGREDAALALRRSGMRLLALDFEPRWEAELRAVESAVQATLGRRHSADFGRCDITLPIDAPANAAVADAMRRGTRLYIASYLVAENAAALRASRFVFFEQLFERAPEGAVCLVLETTHRQFPGIARAAWRGGGRAVAVACPRVRSNRGFSLCMLKRPAPPEPGSIDEFGPDSDELARLFRRFETDDERHRADGGGRQASGGGQKGRRVSRGGESHLHPAE